MEVQQRCLMLDPVEYFFGYPEISHRIFDAMPVKDLLSCSQVKKSWRREANEVANGRQVIAHVVGTCKNIKKLNRHICDPANSFINGLHINVAPDHRCLQWFKESQSLEFCSNLVNLPVRYLSLHLGPCFPAMSIMGQILLKSHETLEQLIITYEDEDMSDEIFDDKLSVTYTKLHTIEIQPKFVAPWGDAIKLIEAAPNVKKVIGLANLCDLKGLRLDKLRHLTGLNCAPFSGLDRTLARLVGARPVLTELRMCDLEDKVLPSGWSEQLHQLIGQSTSTLKKLSICAIELVKYASNDEPVLSCLEWLEVCFPEKASSEHCDFALAQLKLDCISPIVCHLRLNFSDNCYHDIPTVASLRQYNRVKCTLNPRIQEVLLQDPPCTMDVMKICAQAFPALKSFAFECLACADICVNFDSGHPYELYCVWTEITTLQKLKICLMDCDRALYGFSLDALLCGITAEEAGDLRVRCRTDTMSLTTLQLCPVRPSLRDACGLAEMTLVFVPDYTYDEFCISEVSRLLVFERMPFLRVTIESHTTTIADRKCDFNLSSSQPSNSASNVGGGTFVGRVKFIDFHYRIEPPCDYCKRHLHYRWA